MLRTILRALAGAAAAVLFCVVTYYALIFGGPLPDHPALRGHNDLALHVAAFLALSLPVLLYDSRRRNIAVLVGFAASIEIVQLFEPHRTADWLDFAGSVTGIAIAALLVGGLRWIGRFWASRGVTRDE